MVPWIAGTVVALSMPDRKTFLLPVDDVAECCRCAGRRGCQQAWWASSPSQSGGALGPRSGGLVAAWSMPDRKMFLLPKDDAAALCRYAGEWFGRKSGKSGLTERLGETGLATSPAAGPAGKPVGAGFGDGDERFCIQRVAIAYFFRIFRTQAGDELKPAGGSICFRLRPTFPHADLCAGIKIRYYGKKPLPCHFCDGCGCRFRRLRRRRKTGYG